MLAGSAGVSGAVVRAAVLAVVEESAVPADEASAAVAIEGAFPGFALLPWLYKFNSGALQGLFDIHVPLVHQAPGLCLEVSQGPDHRFLWGVADRFGSLKLEVVGHLEPVCVAYWPPVQGNVVPIPLPWDLKDDRASRRQLVSGFVQADVLMVYTEVRVGIDVILRPGNVCFPAGAVQKVRHAFSAFSF